MSQIDEFEAPRAALSVHRGRKGAAGDAWARVALAHPLNRRVEIVMASRDKSDPVKSIASAAHAAAGTSAVAGKLLLVDLLKEEVRAAVMNSSLVISSTGRIDTNDAFMIFGSTLQLSLTRDTYTRAGLTGKQSKHQKDRRYTVSIDLASAFKPGGKLFDRVHWSFTHVLTDPFEAIICAAKDVSSILPAAWEVTPLPVTLTSGKIAAAPPSCAADADAEQLFDLHEWLGLVACGATQPATSQESFQPFVSSYQAADPDSSLRVSNYVISGLLSSDTIRRLIVDISKVTSAAWTAVTVWGVADAPITWRRQEHSYFTSGQDSYTIWFPGDTDRFIVFQTVDSLDELPPLS